MSTAETANAIEPLDERGSAVRFETQCVVIPDHNHHSLLPRVVTKSYTLPLWKRRSVSAGPSSTSVPQEKAVVEENQSHLVLRVPLPTFSRKSYATTRAAEHTPLPPCLVHRPQPASPTTPSHNRHARTPRKTSPSPSRSDLVTVPLRPCCAACQAVTEAALVDGDAWSEHFTRAASRRRSASVDGSPRTITVAGSAASVSYGDLSVAISVDEIDKRRRASDTGPSTSHDTWARHAHECRAPFSPYHTAMFGGSAAEARPPPSPSRATPATPRIPEEEDDEDENELFPLPSPSPRRTPSTSPAPSLTGSMTSLTVAQPAQSSGTSPTPSSCSGDFCSQTHPTKRHLLAPPCGASSSSLSLPKLSESTTDLNQTDIPPRAPSPSLLSALPSLSGRHRSRSPSPLRTFVPPTPTGTSPLGGAAPLASPTTPISIPPRSPPPSFTSPRLSPSQTRLPWRSRRSASTDIPSPTAVLDPELSPTLSSSGSKKSFSMSSPLQLFADVMRGVGGVGSGGIVPGV